MKNRIRITALVLLAAIMLFSAAAGEETQEIRTGDRLFIGVFPQTAEGTDRTPIEWVVLAVQDGRGFLMSRRGLIAMAYHTEDTDVTWEACALRAWLNNEFYREAFSEEEKAAILLTDVDNSTVQRYSKWKKPKEPDTQDYVYLLSYAEARKYLGTEKGVYSRKARIAPTDYAVETGAHVEETIRTAEGERTGWWMLRSPGGRNHGASCVNNGGGLSDCNVTLASGCICPVMWVDLSSSALKTETPASE